MSKKSCNRTQLTTQKVRQISARHNKEGVHVHANEVLGPKALASHAVKAWEQQRARLQAMSAEECQRLETLAEQWVHSDATMFDYDDNTVDFRNILTGAHPIDVSHAGGKFQDLAREIYGDFWTLLPTNGDVTKITEPGGIIFSVTWMRSILQHTIKIDNLLAARGEITNGIIISIIRSAHLIDRAARTLPDARHQAIFHHLQTRIRNTALCLMPDSIKETIREAIHIVTKRIATNPVARPPSPQHATLVPPLVEIPTPVECTPSILNPAAVPFIPASSVPTPDSPPIQ
ncbi:hypothetical protein F4604DRAFT_1923121 [Suillus subluteus]|nr:hypothetical protein F4604DRAFT_1923121 [Suillus subluteus]